MKNYFLINFPQGNSNGLFAVISLNRDGYATLKEQLASVTGTGVKLSAMSIANGRDGIFAQMVEVPEEGYLGDAMRLATHEGTQMLRQLTPLLAETMAPLDDDKVWVASVVTSAEGFEFNAMAETEPGDMPLDFQTEKIPTTELGLVAPRDYTPEEYKKIAAVLTRQGQGSTSIRMGYLLAAFDSGMARKFAKGFRAEFDSALCEWRPEMGMGTRYIEGYQ